jgi:hypothetical protein
MATVQPTKAKRRRTRTITPAATAAPAAAGKPSKNPASITCTKDVTIFIPPHTEIQLPAGLKLVLNKDKTAYQHEAGGTLEIPLLSDLSEEQRKSFK